MAGLGDTVPVRVALALALLLLGARAGEAEEANDPSESCPALIASGAPRIWPAALTQGEVRLTFVGHATFLIESPGAVRIATDYNDHVRPSGRLDVVTMNKAHSTHYTDRPDPGIRHVLRGWNPGGSGPARHDLSVGDVRVRNVSTNIRHAWSGMGTEYDGNSMFVFEVAGVCIAHLGHLHHALEPSHLKKLGRIDVVLFPVDGGYTLDLLGMMEVLGSLNPKLMIPMHYFGPSTLNRFLDLARERYEVAFSQTPTLVVSRETLPKVPQVLVLPGR